ncbi:spore germination protein GerW family protein [Planococcus salinarum]|uniref:spore germination protein GerW family protein n=1 Tax=Planococcus salinarum TaxID=622695 RepID=UPI00163D81EE|nr:spore germination protein GerW family protein [Planococcus salinarum]
MYILSVQGVKQRYPSHFSQGAKELCTASHTTQLKGVKNTDEKEVTPLKSSPVLPIFEKFSKARDVSLIYGDPVEMHGRTIIPVAKVKYSVGAGSGSGFEHEDKDPASPGYEEVEGGQGEGAGGSFLIKPVGIYDVTAEKTVYRPIVPFELIVLLPLMMTGLIFLMVRSQEKQNRRMDHQKRRGMRGGNRCKDKGQGRKMKGMGHSD